MTNETFIQIVGAIFTILVALITTFVIPWIRNTIGNENLEKLDKICKMAVRCAEQIFDTEEYAEKKEYVLTYITDYINRSTNLTLSAKDIDVLIESAVNEVKYGGVYLRN